MVGSKHNIAVSFMSINRQNPEVITKILWPCTTILLIVDFKQKPALAQNKHLQCQNMVKWTWVISLSCFVWVVICVTPVNHVCQEYGYKLRLKSSINHLKHHLACAIRTQPHAFTYSTHGNALTCMYKIQYLVCVNLFRWEDSERWRNRMSLWRHSC